MPAPHLGRDGLADSGDIERDELEPVETERGDYPRFYTAIVEALRDGTPPPASAADAVAVLEVIEAAFESARSGRLVSLPAG